MVPTGAMKAYIVMARGYSTIYADPNRSYCVALGIPHAATRWGAWKLAWLRERAAFINETVPGVLSFIKTHTKPTDRNLHVGAARPLRGGGPRQRGT